MARVGLASWGEGKAREAILAQIEKLEKLQGLLEDSAAVLIFKDDCGRPRVMLGDDRVWVVPASGGLYLPEGMDEAIDGLYDVLEDVRAIDKGDQEARRAFLVARLGAVRGVLYPQ